MKSFVETKKLFKKVIQDHLALHPAGYAEKEAALPAYAHSNPLIDMLFWGRLRVAYDMSPLSQTEGERKHVLDFGCGTGVLSYIVGKSGHNVVGVDTELGPLSLIQQNISFPTSCTFLSASQLSSWNQEKFDIIFALDVLEHVPSLDETLRLFKSVITPGGILVVSAPTENAWYALGRRLAGKEFTGEYHHTTSADIFTHCAREGTMLKRRTLYPLIPLFDIFTVKI